MTTPARIAWLYAAIASLWILLSDRVVQLVVGPASSGLVLQTGKGLFYVAATALLLYTLIRRDVRDLERTERKLRAVVESMSEGVLVASADGSLVDANPAAVSLLGLPDRPAASLRFDQVRERLRQPDGSPLHRQCDPLAAVLEGRSAPLAEIRVRRPAATEDRIVTATAAPVRLDGTVPLVVMVLRDVTELRRYERLRDEFLSTAAHELKTPVAAIKGYVQLLQRWAPEGHEPRERAAFGVLNRQCDRITRLVQELLEVSRMQLGRLELRRQRFEVGELSAEVLMRMQAITSNHHLLLRRDGAVEVEADPDRLEQVLVNLLDNAIRFSPSGGSIVMQVEASGAEAHVSIQDPGLGIPMEQHGQVFQPFHQAHAGTRYHFQGGIGMGLHISREIVERHGGRIWFESEEGRGSVFHFSLPLASGGAAHERAQSIDSGGG